ncbi:hypothetical protein [Amycolatopsis saalfeldensis]|uniref:Uncharacterized protein n=1 Tax=Amycolatopsis saalfeldensis TaxID=394193 RepID=A0A1H8Y2V7_9PSEU|nr:hypothetical protein [Amycolatopsis saalfeldensis]SEP46515.1 hypothetical protein SAMN04489732_110274 [Amycolatopsis saalfeldensis]
MREKLLQPFPDKSDDLTHTDLARINLDPTYLISRHVAIYAPRNRSDLQIHPDVLFALRLTDKPSSDSPPRARK